MTKEQKIIRAKVGLLELARQLGNVSQACKMMGYSRDSFYRFKELYDAGGELALQELTRRKPILKNRTPPDVEAIIVELSLDRPAYGQNPHRQRASQARPFDFAGRGNASAEVVVVHPLDVEDAVITAAMRAKTSSTKGVTRGIEARGQFDALMQSVLPRDDVTFEEDTLGGVPGLWVHPADWQSDEAILHLHGGWFNFGSAKAFRNLVAHIAARAAARGFIPEYRLAPEHSFPAAPDDALACCQGLAERGVHRIALTGDSAGGNLALGLASRMTGECGLTNATLVGVAVLSPVTDLTLSGASDDTRADADPFFTRPQVAELVRSYLKTADPKQSLASPLHAQLSGMPPVRVHVGSDEALLDDSLRYVERAFAAGVDARVDVWTGMPHGFAGSVGKLKAAAQTLDAMGTFLAERRQAGA